MEDWLTTTTPPIPPAVPVRPVSAPVAPPTAYVPPAYVPPIQQRPRPSVAPTPSVAPVPEPVRFVEPERTRFRPAEPVRRRVIVTGPVLGVSVGVGIVGTAGGGYAVGLGAPWQAGLVIVVTSIGLLLVVGILSGRR